MGRGAGAADFDAVPRIHALSDEEISSTVRRSVKESGYELQALSRQGSYVVIGFRDGEAPDAFDEGRLSGFGLDLRHRSTLALAPEPGRSYTACAYSGEEPAKDWKEAIREASDPRAAKLCEQMVERLIDRSYV